MPIPVTMWQCGICHATYRRKEETENCEDGGEPTPKYKKGDAFISVNKHDFKIALQVQSWGYKSIKQPNGTRKHIIQYRLLEIARHVYKSFDELERGKHWTASPVKHSYHTMDESKLENLPVFDRQKIEV